MSDIIPTPTLNTDQIFGGQDIDAPVISNTRMQRLKLLKESDWTQTGDSPLSSEKKAEWATYRQALRDLPASDNPNEFPAPPSA